VSSYDPDLSARATTTQLVADFLATFALFAAALGGRDRYLVPVTVAVTTACWFLGMLLAIALDRPIF
jgi:hypothetical protein